MWKKKSFIISVVCAALALGAVLILRARGSNPDRILARADEYFEAEAFDEARIEYLKALREDAGNARAIRQLGLTYAEMGSPIQAGMFLTKANEDAPSDLEVLRELAKALFAANQFGSAREKAMAILDSDPNDGETLLLLANLSVTEEQLAEVSSRLKALDSNTNAYYHLASAILGSRQGGGIEAAKASVDKAQALDPESAAVQLALATYFEATNERESLLAALAKASGFSPARSSARLRYARVLAQEEGKAEEAEKLVREITETSRSYLPAWNLLAEWALQKGDSKAATGFLKEVLGRDSMNPEARILEAGALLADEKTKEAVAALEELDRLYPNNVRILMILAQAHLKAGDAVRTGATLDEILKLVPDHIEANLLQAQLNLRSGASIAAANALEKLLKLRPDLEQAELLLARAYQMEGRNDDAADVFRAQIERHPERVGAHFLLGIMLQQNGDLEGARASFEKAQSLSPKDMAITFQLIDNDLVRKDFDSAHKRATAQEALNPGDWAPFYFHGKIYSAEEKWEEAEKALLKALEINPDSLTVYDLLLNRYLAEGRVEEVIARIESYLERNPKGVSQRLILAMLYEREGEVEKATTAYERILEDQPDFISALNNLAYIYSGPGKDLDRAFELAKKAREMRPEDSAIADTLGWIHFRRKEYAEALPLLEEAANTVSENAEIQYHLGMARYMRGQKDAARAALEKALALSDEFPGKAEAEKQLALLAKVGGDGGTESMDELLERLKATPDDVVARMSLARLQAAEGNFKEAAASYAKALDSNPGLVEALTSLARLYVGPLDDLDRAADYARRARALDGRNPAAARALGEVVLRQGDYRYGYNLLTEASRASEEDASLKAALGRAAYGVGRTDEAREAMQWIIDNASGAPEAAEAGRLLSLTSPTERPTEGIVEAALKEDPDSLPALMAKVALSEAEGERAIEIVEGILKRHADFVPAQAGLAALLATDTSRLDEAQTLAEKARLALPDDPALARTLGLIRYGKGDAKSAVRYLLESEAKNTLDAEGLFYLGMAHLKAGQKAEGVSALDRARADSSLPDGLRQEADEALADAAKDPTP